MAVPTRPLCAWLTLSDADTRPADVVPMRPSVVVDVVEVRAAAVVPTRPLLVVVGRDSAASTRLDADAEFTPAVGRVEAPAVVVPTRPEFTVGRELTPAVCVPMRPLVVAPLLLIEPAVPLPPWRTLATYCPRLLPP